MTIVIVVALFVSIGAQLAVPQVVQFMIDTVTDTPVSAQELQAPAAESTASQPAPSRMPPGQALVLAMVGIVVLSAVCGGFTFTQSFTAEKMSQNLAFDLRNNLFTKIEQLSFSYHDEHPVGQLMVRATDDVEKVRSFLGQGLLMILQALILLIGAITLMLMTSWQLTLVVLPVLPIAVILFQVFGTITQPLFMKIQIALSALNTVLQENVAGIKLVKAFVREPLESARFTQYATEFMQRQIDLAKVFSFLFPVIFLVANLGQAILLYAGGFGILYGDLTLGEWQKFSLYLVLLFFPIGQLGLIITQMNQASASAIRIFEILDAPVGVADKPGAPALSQIQGHVSFKDVDFRYFDGTGDPVLSGINIEAQPGQVIALLGATGSGKSTVVNLIPRFYDVSEGQLLIDGKDVRDVQLASLRSQVGVVFQETELLTGTIRYNIAFGRPDAGDDDIIAAAKAAAADDFIRAFPQGYDTPVAEGGTSLSGGQKQRIAIARALLLDPRILILDDATASVDAATESHILEALANLMKDRTSFVIAERIHTVESADQILVLDKGRIVAQGRHADLLASNAIYAEIYHSQLMGRTNAQ